MSERVLIPVRGIKSSMSRLRRSFDEDLISRTVENLLSNTVTCLQSVGLEPIILTADTKLEEKYQKRGILVLTDDGQSLNTAIIDALQNLDLDRAMLVMPDLPGLNTKSLQKVLSLRDNFSNIIVPTIDNGTAIAILPRDLMAAGKFGENSSKEIYDLACEQKIPLSFHEIMDLQYDLDTIEDWEYWQGKSPALT